MGRVLRPTGKFNHQEFEVLKSPIWAFQHHSDRGRVYKISGGGGHHEMLHSSPPQSESSLSESKRRHFPRPTPKTRKISMPRPTSHPMGRKESEVLLNACVSAGASRGRTEASQPVTRSRPRSQRAAAGASCLGGEGRTPVPSGRCLACEGSPASSASGGTSGDPGERGNVVWENTRFLLTFVLRSPKNELKTTGTLRWASPLLMDSWESRAALILCFTFTIQYQFSANNHINLVTARYGWYIYPLLIF